MTKPKSLKAKAFARAKELGATVEINPGGDPDAIDFGVEAPPGYLWKGTDIHEFIIHGWISSRDKHRFDWAWLSALDEMNQGVERCWIKDCEWCEETLQK